MARQRKVTAWARVTVSSGEKVVAVVPLVISWATEQGIINGVGQGRVDPNGTLPYDQILTLLCRASGGDASGSDWSAAAVNWAADNGLTEGLSFFAKDSCPRADVAYCLWKQLAD